MENGIDYDRIGAVVVTYFPERNYNERIFKIISQFQLVVVVDNTIGGVEFSEDLIDKVILIKNNKNLGVAKALNQGVSQLATKGIEWVSCFDQDTSIKDDYLSVMLAVKAEVGSKECVYGSEYRKNKWDYFSVSKKSYSRCTTVITSGSMFSVALWRKLKGFNEGYFIDSVDHEFCLKARSKKYDVIKSRVISIEHDIGEKGELKGFGFVPVHSPVRKYYIARNVVLTVKQYFTNEPLWCLKQFARLFLEFMSVVVVERDKLKKLKCFFLGLAHGVMGKKGAYLNES